MEATNKVNPAYVSAPYEASYLFFYRPAPSHWSRKRRLKYNRRKRREEHKRQARRVPMPFKMNLVMGILTEEQRGMMPIIFKREKQA